ncbi:MAG: glycosyltransferase [Deltaproteobacteria bacterium]|nr:glycosyltransferase [Deltaproteobacteria bacterium]
MGLTTQLHQAGHRSVVAADPRGVLSARLRAAGLPEIALRIRNHVDMRAGLQLRRLVRTGSFDIVHFHTARAHALSPWLQGLGVKRLVTRRMDYALRPGAITRLLYLQCVDTVVAISTGVRAALLTGGIPEERIRLIPSGIDTSRFAPNAAARQDIRARYVIDPQTPLIVAVGALVARKDHSLLLATAHLLKTQGYTLRYLICGEGPLRADLEAEAAALDLGQAVQFTGFCPDIPRFLSAADLFVHVPHHEGLGVAVVEALAAGLPTIASRVGGIPELIADEQTGLLIPPQDASALATAIVRLLAHPEFARQLGAAGQTVVRARFDVTAMAQANETLYLELFGVLSSTEDPS